MCGCHSLNLVLCDMANSCAKATSFFVCYNIYVLYFLLLKRVKKFTRPCT